MPSLVVFEQPAMDPVSLSEVMSFCHIDESNQEPPPSQPLVSLGSGSGNVDNGAHRYVCTFITGNGGETQVGGISMPINVINNAVNGRVNLTNIPIGGSLVVARKIYRTAANESDYLYLATINDNSTTTYQDNISDGDLGAQAPLINTTADPIINILIQTATKAAEAILKRYIITQTIDMYLDGFPEWEITLPPLQSVQEITYLNDEGVETTLSGQNYLVDKVSEPARLTPAYGQVWPISRYQTNAVKIRFIAGYGDAGQVPSNIKQWILLRVKEAYDHRNAVNVGNAQLFAFPYSYVDGLLDPERVWGL